MLDGDELAALGAVQAAAAADGRFLKFVPASGAASRMFKAPLWALGLPEPPRRDIIARLAADGNGDARDLVALMDGLGRIGFFPDLERNGRGPGRRRPRAARRGGVARRPRRDAHRRRPRLRRPAEGADPVPSLPRRLAHAGRGAPRGGGRLRPRSRRTLSAPLHRVAAAPGRASARCSTGWEPTSSGACGSRFEIGFSFQKPSTDTIAADETNDPFRTRDGTLLFRPGGHGALLENLSDLGADLVYVKNVDNVVPERLLAPTVEWKRALGGLLVTLQRRVFELLEDLETPSRAALEAALAFVTGELLLPVPVALRSDVTALASHLRDRLDRPLRVCGMVRNLGDPGGGPFWVRGRNGDVTAQIVETAQVDAGDPAQKALLAAATHFNPVDLVCALRDRRGAAYPLARFVDPDAVFLSQKSHEGRVLKALEHPGLWNGSMAGWNTVFVEVPSITLNPVKTVNDLLRPEHQPA